MQQTRVPRKLLACAAAAALCTAGASLTAPAGAATPPPAQDTTSLCQNVPSENPFTDVGAGPHHDNVLCLATAGITQGTSPGVYSPDTLVTRGQMATFLARWIDEINRLEKAGSSLENLPSDDDDDDFFDDVPK